MLFGTFDFHTRETPPSSEELAIVYEPYIEACIAAFGPERGMFESNFPPDGVSSSYAVVWNAFKRLVVAPPRDWQEWTHPESEAVPACVVEMLNPRRQFHVNLGSIAAIHRVVSWGDAADVIDPQDARCIGGAA